MEEYKVKYQFLGEDEQVTEWMHRTDAIKKFEDLKKSGKCVWSEVLHSPLDEDEDFYGERVVEQFTRKVIEILGHEMVVPL